jgi:GNAT superfamily N-acetyltransferase
MTRLLHIFYSWLLPTSDRILTASIDIKNSIIPEDQVEVSEDDIAALINTCRSEKLPCIVAIRGCVPSLKSPKNSFIHSKSLLPKFENVIGFGVAQTYGYGFSGLRTGRSRTTADLQFYVHHEYTRKGVGRSILDRLIQCLSPSYA